MVQQIKVFPAEVGKNDFHGVQRIVMELQQRSKFRLKL